MSRRPGNRRLLLLCGIAALAALLAAPSAQGRVSKRKIGDFDEPVYATGAPGFRKLLFVVERGGTVRVAKRNRKLHRPFLDIRGLVGDGFQEQGLLSVAFPPDYKQSRRFYAFFTDNQGDLRIEEFKRRGATRARRGSRRPLLEIRHRANDNHNGGQLAFLGDLLYISTGDGGGGGDPSNNAQNRDSLLGKILRIDPRNPPGGAAYSLPGSNPFVGRDGRDEVFSYGLRNPFRFSFDRGSDGPYIVIGDVGQDRFEEVDYETVGAASGANFGWNAFEGFSPYPGGSSDPGGTTKPILAYGRGRGCTVIGGYVVRDPRLRGLRGRYLYIDFCEGQLRSLRPKLAGARRDRPVGVNVDSPTSFGVDQRNRIYICSLAGPVYRILPG
ncbi:MAG: PQQ-dependent sugar dehydrogenase [Actinomycetota bacterium]